MKNIHTLPTEKPSKIGQSVFDKSLHFNPIFNYELEKERVIPQNIYITYDVEIKEGDWLIIIDDFETYVREHKGDNLPTTYHKKIILTTDQDLDGVQAIEDEFLEWFVKNPSCEWVEVKKGKMKLNDDGEEYGFPDMSLYKIIIPKETLEVEEAAAKHFNEEIFVEGVTIQYALQEAFIKGGLWMQERMYSEEEVLDLLRRAHFVEQNIDEWFETYKKK